LTAFARTNIPPNFGGAFKELRSVVAALKEDLSETLGPSFKKKIKMVLGFCQKDGNQISCLESIALFMVFCTSYITSTFFIEVSMLFSSF